VAGHQRSFRTNSLSDLHNKTFLTFENDTKMSLSSVINCQSSHRNCSEELSSHLLRDGCLISINLSVSQHIPRFQESAVQSQSTQQPLRFPVTVTQHQCTPTNHTPLRSISILYTLLHLDINIIPSLYLFPLTILYITLLCNA